MFENIKEEQSGYVWKTLNEKEEKEQKFYNKSVKGFNELRNDMYKNIVGYSTLTVHQRKEKEILQKIVKLRADEVIYLAYEKWIPSSHSGVVFLDPDTGELTAGSWTTGTCLSPESNQIILYKLDQNWLNNVSLCLNDIISDEEWDLLRDKFDNPSFADRKQLEAIEVDLDTRLMDHLRWSIEEG